MAFSEIERKRIDKDVGAWCAARVPEHLWGEIRLEYRVAGHTIDIFEVRPDWKDRRQTMETPCARIRYVRTKNTWQLYWQRADLKWHRYDPLPESARLDVLVAEIDKDPVCCFFG